MRSGGGQIVKLSIALVAIVAACWIGSRAFSVSDDSPADTGHVNYYKCSVCGTVQKLTDAQMEGTQQFLYRPPGQDKAGGRRFAGVERSRTQIYLLQCSNSTCKQYGAWPAVRCPKDGEIYVDRRENGAIVPCPKCSGAAAGSGAGGASAPQGRGS